MCVSRLAACVLVAAGAGACWQANPSEATTREGGPGATAAERRSAEEAASGAERPDDVGARARPPVQPAWTVDAVDVRGGRGGARVTAAAIPGVADDMLRRGDVIVRVDDLPVGSAAALDRALRSKAPGDVVLLDLVRDGALHVVGIQVSPAPAPTSRAPTVSAPAPAGGALRSVAAHRADGGDVRQGTLPARVSRRVRHRREP